MLEHYDVNFCYLFGSYAKGKETPMSDEDLLISANVKGLKFYGLVEELRTTLKKKVDVLDINQLKDNLDILVVERNRLAVGGEVHYERTHHCA